MEKSGNVLQLDLIETIKFCAENVVMTNKLYFLFLCAALTSSAQAQDTFTGDTKLACEAVLCLATAKRPSECDPAVARYRSIKHKKLRDTLDARRAFLASCPMGIKDPQLESLLTAQAAAEQYCDVWYLNRRNDPRLRWEENRLDARAMAWAPGMVFSPISDVLPASCAALAAHPYTADAVPKYVGTPELYGFWVKPEEYEARLAAYTADLPALRARKEAEEAAAAAGGGGQ